MNKDNTNENDNGYYLDPEMVSYKITCSNLKWVDNDSNDITEGVPETLTIPNRLFPHGFMLDNEGCVGDDVVDTIAEYLFDRFGYFAVSLDITVDAE